MRALRIVGIVLGCFVAAVIIALIAIRLLVNPNDYKGRIEQIVKSSTGRELSLPGEIKLSVFPWIAVELGPATLGNPPGFGAEPFASIQHASLRVRLLPLLRKQLQIGRVEVDGLDLRLKKNAQGVGNWQNFGGSSSQSSSGSSSAALQELGGVVVKDSRLSYQDMVADHVDLDIGRVASGASVPIEWSLDLATSRGAPPIGIAGKATLIPDFAQNRYRLAPLSVGGTMAPAAGAAPVQWKLAAPDASLDLQGETFGVPAFTAQLASAQVSGSIKGNLKGSSPSADGTFKLQPVSLRQLMSQLAITPPQTRDPKALSQLAASGTFSYGGNAARAGNLDVRLDDSTLRGNAAITNLATEATTFDLTLDHIDLDRYRSPETPKSAAQPAPKPAQKSSEPATKLPTQLLKRLQVNGKLAIGDATVSGIKLTQVAVDVAANGGLTRIAPASAKLYGGSYGGTVTLDARSAIPVLSLDQQMTGIDVAQLLQDFAKTRRLSGRGNVTAKLTARGSTTDAMMRSLDGHVAANLANGAIEGIDLWTAVNGAVALAQKQALPAGQSSGSTKFDTFKASADLTNGVASTKDLNISSGDLRVTGQGTTNLVTGAVDYRVQATILKGAGKSAGTLADIPLLVSGTMTSPTVRPDAAGLAKSLARRELEKHKGEVQKKLQGVLKGLFH